MTRPYGGRTWIRFLAPTALGILLYLIPFPWADAYNIGIGIISDLILAVLRPWMPLLATAVICLSAVVSLLVSATGWRLVLDSPALTRLFSVTWGWLLWRIAGAIIAAMVYFQAGPGWIISPATGGNMMTNLLPIIFVLLFLGMLLLPLLTDYGLMDLIGTLLKGIFRKVFSLPGRSAIDAVASWMGSGTVGVVITSSQFRSGFYTEREAAVISTNFSIVSTAFCVVIAQTARVDQYFVLFYATVVVAGIAAAVITPRIPPLAGKQDRYYPPVGKQIGEESPPGVSSWEWGLQQALAQARRGDGPLRFLQKGLVNGFDIWFGLQPIVMAIGTLSLAIAEYTNFFEYAAYPARLLLQALSVPQAAAAAPAVLVGFADQFLPALLAQELESDLTRFVLAGLSVSQLIYMSEVGVLILRSRIPLNLVELFVIFLIRTAICLPIFALAGHLFLGS